MSSVARTSSSRLAGSAVIAVVLEDGLGDPPAGHLVGAADPGRALEVVEALDPGGVVGRGDDHHHVGGELDHLAGDTGVLGRLHRRRVGGREHVSGGTVRGLLGEVGAGPEREGDVRLVLLLEADGELLVDVGEGGRRQDGQLALGVALVPATRSRPGAGVPGPALTRPSFRAGTTGHVTASRRRRSWTSPRRWRGPRARARARPLPPSS